MSFFEDVAIGETTDLGEHLFTAEDIVRFARAYDPQSFHVDPEAAKTSHFGALCASGWHTAAVWMKLMVAHRRRHGEDGGAQGAVGPSPGFEDLKWSRPVYAGEVIRYRSTVHAKRPLQSRPGWGLVQTLNEGFNEKGEKAFSFIGAALVRKREA